MTFATPKNMCVVSYTNENSVLGSHRDSIWRSSGLESIVLTSELLYILTQIPFWVSPMNLRYLYQQRILDQNDSFRYFRLLMSTGRDLICENTFETSNVRFIHENFSVLITTPLDQIQQNLLRKETCQTTVKPADIVLQTWFEEYNPTLRTLCPFLSLSSWWVSVSASSYSDLFAECRGHYLGIV